MNIELVNMELDELAEMLVEELKTGKYYIATAESCTGGMIAASIVNISGASYVMNESYITYSNEAKERILGVNHETLEKYGAVSAETAEEMVRGLARVASVDCAIAVTGIAGPEGGTPDKPVGTVYAGLYFKGSIVVKRYNFDGNRYEIREKTTKTTIIDMLGIIRNIKKN